jgi:hypothetical protein
MTALEKRIQWCGVLIFLGITILVLSLLWEHPLSFMAFLILGCPLVLAGVLLYLYTLSVRN